MDSPIEIPPIASLEYFPYLDENGCIPEECQGKIGVYAIFNSDKVLQFVGYSRDIYLSLKQHLVRQPEKCYWFKIKTIARPSRTILEEIRQKWLQENGTLPPGNGLEEAIWTEPINVKAIMNEEDKNAYQKGGELEQIKLLKQICRRLEAQIQENLKTRGVTMEIRFNPKLKEQGLLDLK
jgi:hypothetical protein